MHQEAAGELDYLERKCTDNQKEGKQAGVAGSHCHSSTQKAAEVANCELEANSMTQQSLFQKQIT